MESLSSMMESTPILQCPITHDRLVHPILVPCCSTTFSRDALRQWLEQSNSCPMCRLPLPDTWTIDTAVINRVVQDLLDNDKNNENEKKENSMFTCHIIPSSLSYDKTHVLAELEVSCNNKMDKKLKCDQPLLLILVLDRSGSMGCCNDRAQTAPIVQVRTAVRYIYDLMMSKSMTVTVECVLFDSQAVRFTFGTHPIDTILSEIRVNGGTCFSNAYNAVANILREYRQTSETEALVLFMTDGEDSFDHQATARVLEPWDKPLTIHTIGFGSGCKHNVLEEMRSLSRGFDSSRPPLPCYVDGEDGADILSSKIAALFEHAVSANTTLPLQLSSTVTNIQFTSPDESLTDSAVLQFNTVGTSYTWVVLPVDSLQEPISIRIQHYQNQNYQQELDVLVPVTIDKDVRPITKKAVAQRWLAQHVPILAYQVTFLSQNQKTQDDDTLELEYAFVHQRIHALLSLLDESSQKNVRRQLEQLLVQLELVRLRKPTDHHVLADLEHAWFLSSVLPASIESNMESKAQGLAKFKRANIAPTQSMNAIQSPSQKQQERKAIQAPKERRPVYSRTSLPTRTPLMNAIVSCTTTCGGVVSNAQLESLFPFMDPKMLAQKDQDGNTALMLAAYCGLTNVVHHLLITFTPQELDLHGMNNDHETALTLAVKRRGFYRTAVILIRHGAIISSTRMNAIREYLLEPRHSRKNKDVVYSFTRMLDELETSLVLENTGIQVDQLCSDHSPALIRRILQPVLLSSSMSSLFFENEKEYHRILGLCMERKELHDLARLMLHEHSDKTATKIMMTVDMLAPWCRDETMDTLEQFMTVSSSEEIQGQYASKRQGWK